MSCGSQIVSGTGYPYGLRVGSNNRAAVDAVTESIEEKSISDGNGYNIATPRITLTSTSESVLFYIKNNEENDLIIKSIFLNTSASAGTLVGAQPELKIYRNPNSGTIISNALSVPINKIFNNKFNSNNELDAIIYYGAEGDTISGHDAFIEVPLATRSALPLTNFEATTILGPKSSYAISYKPETGSTSVDVIAGITIIKLPEEFA